MSKQTSLCLPPYCCPSNPHLKTKFLLNNRELYKCVFNSNLLINFICLRVYNNIIFEGSGVRLRKAWWLLFLNISVGNCPVTIFFPNSHKISFNELHSWGAVKCAIVSDHSTLCPVFFCMGRITCHLGTYLVFTNSRIKFTIKTWAGRRSLEKWTLLHVREKRREQGVYSCICHWSDWFICSAF